MEEQLSISKQHFEKSIFGWLEALLFAAGEPVQTAELARVVGLSRDETTAYLEALKRDYQDEGRGLMLVRVNDSWQLATKPALFPLIQALHPYERQMRLSRAATETLAVIAYRQPVTRVDVEQIRGVSSASSLKALLDHELIAEAGRKDAPGRPFFYKTTDTFLRAAGLSDLSELPPIARFEEKDGKEEKDENEAKP